MNKRQYLLLHGWLYALVVAILLVIFVFQEIDQIGIIFGTIIIFLLSYKSYSCFKEIKNTRKEDNVCGPPADASTIEKIVYYKRIFVIGTPAFIFLIGWTYWELNNLESGSFESIRLWEPISLLYDLGGFWLAVLFLPILWTLIGIEVIFKIKKLKNSDNNSFYN